MRKKYLNILIYQYITHQLEGMVEALLHKMIMIDDHQSQHGWPAVCEEEFIRR